MTLALNWKGARPIDAEVRRWETRSAQGLRLLDKASGLGVTPRGAAVVNGSRRAPSFSLELSAGRACFKAIAGAC